MLKREVRHKQIHSTLFYLHKVQETGKTRVATEVRGGCNGWQGAQGRLLGVLVMYSYLGAVYMGLFIL